MTILCSDVECVTGPQKRMIMTLSNSCFGFSKDVRLRIVSHIIGKPCDSITGLTKRQASKVIDLLLFAWDVAGVHAEDSPGWDLVFDKHVEPSVWGEVEDVAEVGHVEAIIGFGEEYLRLAASHQVDLVSEWLDCNVVTLYALTVSEADRLWERYSFAYKLLSNYGAIVNV